MKQDFISVITENSLDMITDDTLRELKAHGTAAFPFQYYNEFYDWSYLESIEWHWHNEMEFVKVLDGSIECNIGEQKLELQAGDAIFINSGVIHRYQAPMGMEQTECRFSDILFAPELIAPRTTDAFHKYVLPLVTTGEAYIQMKKGSAWQPVLDCYERIEQLCRKEQDKPELRIQMHLAELWLLIAPYLEKQEMETQDKQNIMIQARLRKMMQFIWDHYTERISLENIAASAHISKSAALRCFRIGMRTSPVGYLNAYRLHRAKELLLSTHSMISEVALAVGFDNVGYFDRVFKREFGLTPKQFAKQKHMEH